MEPTKAKYVWDYDISHEEFDDILSGRYTRGSLDRDWAAVRVIEWAPYEEMVRLIGFPQLVKEWPRWRSRVRSEQQRRGIDFLVEWLPTHHPELLTDAR
ncbi:MAG: hypothetical protein AABN34_24535 [Acidobacteriota bacterium]